jgi:Raf kinase inhibitor-like YbhB/YbcL family protein
MSRKLLLFFVLALTWTFVAASDGGDVRKSRKEGSRTFGAFGGATTVQLTLTSTAFSDGAAIPAKYTCDGQDLSPPLRWSHLPQGTKSIALICDDPDAPVGTWVHWVLYGLSGSTTELPEGVPASEALPNGAKQGLNDFQRIGYGGPCPPAGTPHRYFFKVYALDAPLTLSTKATKKDLLRAVEGHVLAEGRLMGTYRRK